jgi:hypothetical protein
MSVSVNPPIYSTLHLDAPIDSFSVYTGVMCDFRAAFFYDGELIDPTGVSFCVFTLKWGSNPAGSPLLYRKVTFNQSLTEEEWDAHTSQHATVTFSSSEAGVDLGGLREARLVATWQLLNSSGSVLSVVTQPVLFKASGVEISTPISGYYTKEEADARFMRLLSTTFVVENFTRLTTLDATDPTVRALADMLCTFITEVQGGTTVIEGEFDVSNFTERLALNGADYSPQEVTNILCTLIQDLKNKGVI